MLSDQLEERIEDLGRLVDEASNGNAAWRDVWIEIRQIRERLKDRSIRFPSRELRDEAWNKLNDIVDRVTRQRERKAERSAEIRDDLLERLNDIYLPIGGIASAGAGLASAFIGSASSGFLSGGGGSHEEQLLHSASETLREIRRAYHEVKCDLLRDDSGAVWSRLNEIQDSVNGAWSELKESKAEAWRERMRERESRLEQLIDGLQSKRAKIESNLDANRDRLADAYSDSYRERVEGWIEEGKERLEEIDEKIAGLSESLDEVRRKLDD